jgi:hypothetical protein
MRVLLGTAAAALVAASLAIAAAPAVTLSGTDVISGKRFSTTSYRGKPVVVVVWSSW